MSKKMQTYKQFLIFPRKKFNKLHVSPFFIFSQSECYSHLQAYRVKI